jgi:hypothetical protein
MLPNNITILICSVDHLKIKGDEKFLVNHLRLVTDPSFVKQWIQQDQEAIKIFGTINLDRIIREPYFCCAIDNASTFLKESGVPNFAALSLYDLLTMEEYFDALWLVKDHSVCVGNYFIRGEYTAIRSRSILVSNSRGEFVDCLFSIDELISGWDLFKRSYDARGKKFDGSKGDPEKFKTPGIQSAGINEIEYRTRNRIDRATNFIKTARGTTLLPMKIAFYCGALECLFSLSSDTTEVTHKVSERVAHYIGSDSEEKKAVFKNVKNFYGLRSKFIHGQTVKQTSEHLAEFSSNCDALVRQVMRKVLDEANTFALDDKQLEAFFFDLIFNENSPN